MIIVITRFYLWYSFIKHSSGMFWFCSMNFVFNEIIKIKITEKRKKFSSFLLFQNKRWVKIPKKNIRFGVFHSSPVCILPLSLLHFPLPHYLRPIIYESNCLSRHSSLRRTRFSFRVWLPEILISVKWLRRCVFKGFSEKTPGIRMAGKLLGTNWRYEEYGRLFCGWSMLVLNRVTPSFRNLLLPEKK